jgi:hypothetical protein
LYGTAEAAFLMIKNLTLAEERLHILRDALDSLYVPARLAAARKPADLAQALEKAGLRLAAASNFIEARLAYLQRLDAQAETTAPYPRCYLCDRAPLGYIVDAAGAHQHACAEHGGKPPQPPPEPTVRP